jgi:manganese oxidase
MIKVRAEQRAGDYQDPGWFKHPPGTLAFEFNGSLPEPARFAAESRGAMPLERRPPADIEVKVRKPAAGSHGEH